MRMTDWLTDSLLTKDARGKDPIPSMWLKSSAWLLFKMWDNNCISPHQRLLRGRFVRHHPHHAMICGHETMIEADLSLGAATYKFLIVKYISGAVPTALSQSVTFNSEGCDYVGVGWKSITSWNERRIRTLDISGFIHLEIYLWPNLFNFNSHFLGFSWKFKKGKRFS